MPSLLSFAPLMNSLVNVMTEHLAEKLHMKYGRLFMYVGKNVIVIVTNEEYILGDPVIGHAASSSSPHPPLSAEEERSNDVKEIMKTDYAELEDKDLLKDLIQCVTSGNKTVDPHTNYAKGNLEDKDVLKDLVVQVKSENQSCGQRTNLIKEEPVDKNDASFIEELQQLAHDVEDNKPETRHYPSSVRLEPDLEMINRHKRTVELCSKKEFSFTSSTPNNGSSVTVNENKKTGLGENIPLNVKEEPVSKSEFGKHETLSNTLLSYKQIEKGQQICEMLFSHIPVADNSATEEIYVSKVTVREPSVPLNEQTLLMSANESEIEDCNISTTSIPDLRVCKTTSEDDDLENSLCDPPTDSCQQLEILGTAETEFSNALRSSRLQTEHSSPETNSRATQRFSACNLVSNPLSIPNPKSSENEVTISSMSVSLDVETKNEVEKNLSHCLDYSKNPNEQSTTGEHNNHKFKCNQCDRTYVDKRHLHRHLMTHTGKQFVCTICSKAFTQPSSLKTHNELKHSVEQNESRKCQVCFRVFKNKKRLKLHHSRSHKSNGPAICFPSTCDVCKKTFKRESNMLTHKRFQHGSDSEFIC